MEVRGIEAPYARMYGKNILGTKNLPGKRFQREKLGGDLKTRETVLFERESSVGEQSYRWLIEIGTRRGCLRLDLAGGGTIKV